MKRIIFLAGMILINLAGCTNQDRLETSSFHVTCNLTPDKIEWNKVTSEFPENFRETTRDIVDKNTVISKGYLEQDLFNQDAGIRHENLLQFQINLTEDIPVNLIETNIDGDLSMPCTNCSMTVIDQSPDGKWVLAEIRDKAYGVWLLTEEKAINIFPQRPSSYHWIWSKDNTSLWISYRLGEVGRTFAIVTDLNSQPIVTEFEQLENFPSELAGNPDLNKYYFFIFDPDDKIIWWFQRFSEDVYMYDTIQKTYELHTIDNFIKTEWQNSLNTSMLVYLNEETLWMESQDGRYSIKIPREIAEEIYTPYTEERFFISNILDRKILIDKEGRYIYVYNDKVVYTVLCE